MHDTAKHPQGKDQEKGDEILRRLLKTPPAPKAGKPSKKGDDKKSSPAAASKSGG